MKYKATLILELNAEFSCHGCDATQLTASEWDNDHAPVIEGDDDSRPCAN